MNILELQKLSDSELYQKCKEYGGNARMWLRKFAGLLPEVHRRKLYKRRGYGSIYEFAAKLAGMNHETVDRILRLDKRLEDKPMLRSKLTSGAASWTKIEKVSYIATPETEKDWVQKVDVLTKAALETYVKEMKSVPGNTFLSENSSSAHQAEYQQITVSFKMNPELELRLRILKQKLEKQRKTALAFQEVFEELMNSYDKKHEATDRSKIKKVVQICPDCTKKKQLEKESQKQPMRYIPADIQKIIDDRCKSKCEFPNCNRPKEIYHHTKRFALEKSHNPDFIIALCKNHERLCHAGLVENEEALPGNWKIRKTPAANNLKSFIDRLVQRYRILGLPSSS